MIHGGIECSQENRLKDIKTIARDSCPSNSAKVSSITNSSILSTALFEGKHTKQKISLNCSFMPR
jgi:hypothetical protein